MAAAVPQVPQNSAVPQPPALDAAQPLALPSLAAALVAAVLMALGLALAAPARAETPLECERVPDLPGVLLDTVVLGCQRTDDTVGDVTGLVAPGEVLGSEELVQGTPPAPQRTTT